MLRRLDEELEEEASIALEREVAHDEGPKEEEGIGRIIMIRRLGKAMVKLPVALLGEN